VKAKMTLTARLAIAMILLVAIAVSAVGWLSYRSLEQALLPRVLDRIGTYSRLVAADLQSYVRGARSDVATFRSHAAAHGMVLAHFNGGIDPVDHISEKAWRERLLTRIVADLGAKPAYSQFRFIGVEDGQRELFRVDRSGPHGAIRVVPDAELQRKGDQQYFKDTIKLAADEIDVSPIDLNEEHGVIETPHVPTLRVAAPVFAPDGKPFGIVVINVNMRPAFDRIRSSAREGLVAYLVNAQGDYLVHPDPSREFGSQLGTPTSWQSDFPNLAASLGAQQGVAQVVLDQAGQPGGVALAPAMLAGSEWVGVIQTMPNAVFMTPAAAIQHSSLLVGLIAVLCAAGLATFVASSLTRPISQLTAAVEGIGRNDAVAIPVDAGGETGVLARAFARVMGDANAKTTALEREIQEHRRTEAARDHHAARERLFSAAVESSNDAVVTMSLDGTITGWNPAAARLFGYGAAEAVGKGIDLIFPADRISEMHDLLRRIGLDETIEHHETVQLRKDGHPGGGFAQHIANQNTVGSDHRSIQDCPRHY
jgi:PAS domain S-box-containing protein